MILGENFVGVCFRARVSLDLLAVHTAILEFTLLLFFTLLRFGDCNVTSCVRALVCRACA